jgi:uncharacterized protein (TIGR03084 family)
MVVAVGDVLDDLADESAWLDGAVRDLDDETWKRPTPAPGWTIAHQIAHLAWTDDQAICSATDPEAFAAILNRVVAGEVTVDSAAAEGAADPPRVLLERWRNGRRQLAETLKALPPGTRMPWYGTTMSPISTATGRMMETWAHGQDIAEAIGRPHPVTGRLRHVAHITVRARDYAFLANGLTPPEAPIFVEVTAPDGAMWTWGPEDAEQRVTGTALDLCLVATQRRHRSDTGLVAVGPDADRWLGIAQAFAGPPGAGRKPRG